MTIAFGVIKLSVLLLYRRLFIGTFFDRYSIAMCVLIVLWSLSFLFSCAFSCGTQIKYAWTGPADTEAHCIDAAAWSVAFAATDVATDLMVLAIPVPIVWRLQKTSGEKLGICGIFLLGLL